MKKSSPRKTGEGDSDSDGPKNLGENKDNNFMPRQLKEWLNAHEYPKALKFAASKMSRGSKTSMFYAVISGFCQLKLGK
jgi:hypothetical protein